MRAISPRNSPGPIRLIVPAAVLDPNVALDDQEELLGEVPFTDQAVPVRNVHLVGELADSLEIGRLATGE